MRTISSILPILQTKEESDQNIQYDSKVNVQNSTFNRKALSRFAGHSILNDNTGTIFEHSTTNVAILARRCPYRFVYWRT